MTHINSSGFYEDVLANYDNHYYIITNNEKIENHSIDDIGKIVSALANTCVLSKISAAYSTWIVDQNDNYINYLKDIELKLLSKISLNAKYKLSLAEFNKTKYILLEVKRAFNTSVSFEGVEYIYDSNKKLYRLNENASNLKEFWNNIDEKSFETLLAMEAISILDLPKYLDITKFYELINVSEPKSINELIDYGILILQSTGMVAITNLGAICFARRIKTFESISNKAVRVVIYNTNSNANSAIIDIKGAKGYAVGYEGLLGFIHEHTPKHEQITKTGIRKELSIYPDIALREIIANMLIHQDFKNNTSNAYIEIFNNRIEFSNPGKPLVKIDKIIESTPKSRNPLLSTLMQKLGICENRGSGFDKIMTTIEQANLPMPKIDSGDDSFKITLYTKKAFELWSIEEKISACYYHSYLLAYNEQKCATSSTLLKRFNLDDSYLEQINEIIYNSQKENKIEIESIQGSTELKFKPK